jgi:hypothetical protein
MCNTCFNIQLLFILPTVYVNGFHITMTLNNKSVLGVVMVIVLAIGPNIRGFKHGGEWWIFKGDENPQHAFRRRGSKVVGSM